LHPLERGIARVNMRSTTVLMAMMAPDCPRHAAVGPQDPEQPAKAINGANTTTRRIMTNDCWICWMSLVLRVTRLAVENRSISSG
jgi:hypothetical protein